ncbi:MAG: hypothetical protein WCJ67_07390 [Thermoleophilia bacterium]
MPLAALSLQEPLGLLLCLLALLPLAVTALAGHRQRNVARSIGLQPALLRGALAGPALAALCCVALGIAVAQPLLTTTSGRSARVSSEVVFVTDISQSMLAARDAGGRTRLDRAREAVARLRAAVPDVPAGISGLTDRVLPYLFPTLDEGTFAETLARSVQVNAPPPRAVSTVATSFAPMTSLVGNGFFTPDTERRTCVLVTDGETRSAGLDSQPRCRLLVVRIGSAAERIFRADGSAVAGYRPESSAATTAENLARSSGGAAFTESDLPAAVAALREAAAVGPRQRVGPVATSHALAPFFAAVSLVGVALILLRTLRRPD